MRRKLITAMLIVVTVTSLIGCATMTASTGSERVMMLRRVTNLNSDEQKLVDNLTKVKSIVQDEYSELCNILAKAAQLGENDDVEVASQNMSTEIEEFLNKCSADTDTLNAMERTGIESVDKTYDAALHLNEELVNFAKDFKEYADLILFFTSAMREVSNALAQPSDDQAQYANVLYKALSNFSDTINNRTYPEYSQSKVDKFTRKIDYYKTAIEEEYWALYYTDPLRLHAAANILNRVSTEFSTAMSEFIESMGAQTTMTSESADEVDVLYEEIVANIDTIINAIEGGN